MIKQKIIHILYSGLGGTTDYVFNMIKADKEREYEHLILFYGIELVPEKQAGLAKKIADKVKFIHKDVGFDRNSGKTVFEFIKIESPNTVILHVNSLILTCSKYKLANLIFVEHQANHLKTKKEWLWSIVAQQKANNIITLTDDYNSDLKSKLKILFRKGKNKVIKTGIVLEDYRVFEKKKSPVIKIGMVSRVNEFRDHNTLINAFCQLSLNKLELHIVGDGTMLESLKNRNDSPNVIFHGNIAQEYIPKILSEFDIYCQASFGETSSIAIMQAQATGLPIMATKVNGLKNILTDDNCVFIEPENIDSYINAMELLVNSEDKRKLLGKKSLEYANKNLSHIRMFEEYKKLID